MGEERYTSWDPGHLEILKKGVGGWNKWRDGGPKVYPDLRDAILTKADLSYANLSHTVLTNADLSYADLRHANLSKARLTNADLSYAELTDAKLSHAELIGTKLSKADLSGADLTYADLAYADLSYAKLSHAELIGARAAWTSLHSTTLARAHGLDQLRHFGPSNIGPEVLEACGLALPDVFLKGIGYKDWEVLNFKLRDPSLRPDQVTEIGYRIINMRTNSPIQTNSIFFSYSSKDDPFVEAIEKRFAEDHIQSWRYFREISVGPIEAQLDQAIELNRTVMLVLSEDSVNSEWVLYEVRKARKLKAKLDAESKKPTHVLCPVALDDSWKNCAWPPRIREDLEDYHILDCSDWKKPSFDAKYEKLKTNLGIYYFGQDRK